MKAVALPDCWGVDTSAKLTSAQARALAASAPAIPAAGGTCVSFVWRYVFFGPARPGDLDAAERDAILAAGLSLLVVSHARLPPWSASGDQGEADARAVVARAIAAGYPPGLQDENGRALSLAYDLEGVRNSGANVAASCERWGHVVREAGYSPVLYVGYASGLTPAELYELQAFDRYWSDAGPRQVATRGFCCRQRAQQTIAGVLVDPDHAYPDALGGTLTALSA